MVKIFLDTANIDEIREAASWGVLDGVTTNPTLVAKTGRKWSEVIQDILALVDGPISLEVTTTQADEMIKQGRQLAKLHQNVVVKIQMTTEGLKAIKALSSEGVRINTTLIFSSNQAILAAKAGAKYVSPFIGRLDDMGQEGMQVIREIVEIFRNYEWDCEVLVASIRHPLHVIEAAKLGADIVTLPFDVLKKMTQHVLTDVGLKRFFDALARGRARQGGRRAREVLLEPRGLLGPDLGAFRPVDLVEDDAKRYAARDDRHGADPIREGVQGVRTFDVAYCQGALGAIEERIPEVLPDRVLPHLVEDRDVR